MQMLSIYPESQKANYPTNKHAMDAGTSHIMPRKKRKAVKEQCADKSTELGVSSAITCQTMEPIESYVYSDSILGMPYSNVYDCYALDAILGSGSYGVVRRCVNLMTGMEYACKSIQKEKIVSPSDVEDIRREVSIMRSLSGQMNIVQLVETFEDNFYLHIIMELCTGGDLFEEISRMGRVDEQTAARIIYQLAAAVASCHERDVIHRDLKPENLFLKSTWCRGSDLPVLKLGDFGLSVLLKKGHEVIGLAGSPFYMAPEVVSLHGYGKEADIWSMGVILYILLCGSPPFFGENDAAIYEAARAGILTFADPVWNSVSQEAKSLIRSMLTVSQLHRPSIQEVLWHPWLLQQLVEAKASEGSSSCVTDGNNDVCANDEWAGFESMEPVEGAPGTPDIWAAPSLSISSLVESGENYEKQPWLNSLLVSLDEDM